jgi:AbrB family looped-hinge helix DNA binding protein
MSERSKLKAVVTSRWQVTIPKPIRDKLGIKPGMVVAFELCDGTAIIAKEIVGNPVSHVYGCLKDTFGYESTDVYIREIRGRAHN